MGQLAWVTAATLDERGRPWLKMNKHDTSLYCSASKVILPKHHFIAGWQKVFPQIWATPTETNICICCWVSLRLSVWFSLLTQAVAGPAVGQGWPRSNTTFQKLINSTFQKLSAPTVTSLHYIHEVSSGTTNHRCLLKGPLAVNYGSHTIFLASLLNQSHLFSWYWESEGMTVHLTPFG